MYPQEVRREALRLLADGATVSRVSDLTGISRAAIRQWRDRGTAPRRAAPACWRCEGTAPPPGSAYAALLGYYLGDGCISPTRTTHTLRVSCDRAYPGIVEDVATTIEAVLPGTTVTRVRAPGVVVVQSAWRHWPCLFPQHGPGRQHDRALVLEPWQREVVEACPADFLRGLFHSDGCRVRNWARRRVAGGPKRYEYPRWQFVNHSADIRRWCCEALDLAGVPWRASSWKTVSVSTREGVARLDELIGLKR